LAPTRSISTSGRVKTKRKEVTKGENQAEKELEGNLLNGAGIGASSREEDLADWKVQRRELN